MGVTDDREPVDREIREATAAQRPFVREYRILHADGTVRWVLERGVDTAERAAVEAPRGLLGHSYRYDDAGRLVTADVVTPTALNAASVEHRLRAAVEQSALAPALGPERPVVWPPRAVRQLANGLRVVLDGDPRLVRQARERGWLIQPSLAR